MSIRIAVVDDHDVVRFGIKYMLRLDGEFRLVAEGSCAEDAVRIAGEVKPDVMLLDIRMLGKSGTDALEDVMETDPDAKVVMLTTSDKEEDVYRSVQGGAKGYLLKETPAPKMVEAIRAVASGGTWLPPEIMGVYRSRAASKELSKREKEILQYVAKGLQNSDIAKLLGVGLDCVKVHMKHVLAKLEVSDRAEAASEGIRRGIID